MSVIQRIRDKGAWVIFGIIALALIAFILQDGIGRGKGGFSNGTTLGKVNGDKIERADFEELITLYSKNGQQTRDQLIPQVWSQEVDKKIYNQEYEKLGITVSSKELSDLLFDPQTSPLKREFTDPATGQFKETEAREAIAQLKKSKNQEQLQMVYQGYIQPTIDQALRTKYQNLLQKSLYVPTWMVEKTQADNNTIASVSFVYVPYSSIVDSTIKVSDDEIMSYVKKHPKGFEKEEETRNFSYVAFDAKASAEDTAAVRNQLESLRNEFATTPDVKAFLGKTGSEMQYYESYIGKNVIQHGAKDSVTKLSIGQLYGPYVDGNSLVLARMVATKQMPDTVKVRHILIGTKNPQDGQQIRTDSAAKKLADSIANVAKAGANFDSLVVKFSDDQGSKDKGGVYEDVTSGKMVPPFNDYIFGNSVGSKDVVKTDFGYHYIEILSQKGSSPAYKIAYLAKPIVVSAETVNNASGAAQKFAGESKDKKAFDANAAKANLPILLGTDVKENDFTVASLGQGTGQRALVRWLYENKAGDVSEPMEIGDRYIVAFVTSVNEKGLPTAAQARPQAEMFVRNEKKAKTIIETKFKGNTLEAYAASAGVPVQRADSLAFNAQVIPGLGNEIKAVGAAFNKENKGKATEPIAGTSGVYSLRVENIGASSNPAADVEAIKQQILQGSRMAIYRGMDALKKVADIKDYRFKFF